MSGEAQQRGGNGGGDLYPVTVATLAKDISALERVQDAKREGSEQKLTTRVHAVEDTQRNFDAALIRVPLEVDRRITQIQATIEEKFNTENQRFSSIETQFTERDVRVEQTARDTKLAVEAALQAAEKAVSKSEVATTKQIDTLGLTILTANAGLDKQLNDLKERVTRMESTGMGRSAAVVDQRAGAGESRAYVALSITILLAILTVLGFALRLH